jgi:hypothetical protein
MHNVFVYKKFRFMIKYLEFYDVSFVKFHRSRDRYGKHAICSPVNISATALELLPPCKET